MPRIIRCSVATAIAFLLSIPPTHAQPDITQSNLLNRLIDLDRLYLPPPVNESVHFFTHNLNTNPCDAADGEWCVIADVTGPGALVRTWFSAPDGMLRIEVDGAAIFEAALETLFDGSRPPFQPPLSYTLGDSGGSSCYCPIGFSQQLRVSVRDCKSAYEMQCIRFPPGTTVESFRTRLSGEAGPALEIVRAALLNGLTDKQVDGPGRILPIAGEASLGPGKIYSESLGGAGVVRALYLAQPTRAILKDKYALHRCVIRVFFDGHAAPTVEAPLIDFFGSGFRRERINTLVSGTNRAVDVPLSERGGAGNEFLYFLLPMPFEKGLRVELLNAGQETVELLLYLRISRQAPPAGALRLHALFRREDPARDAEYELLRWNGQGRVVGALLLADSPRESDWGAGGVKLWLDRVERAAPNYDGLHLGSWLGTNPPLTRIQTGLHAISLAGSYGKSSGLRWLLADAIPFSHSARAALSAPPADGKRDTWLGSLVWWYGPAGGEQRLPRLQAGDLEVRSFQVPHAIEIEGRVRDVSGAPVSRVSDEGERGVEFSNGAAVVLEPGRDYEIAIPSANAREVDLRVRVHPRQAFEVISVTGPDQVMHEIKYDRDSGGIYAVSRLQLKSGITTVRVRCGAVTVLDCWIATSPTASQHDR